MNELYKLIIENLVFAVNVTLILLDEASWRGQHPSPWARSGPHRVLEDHALVRFRAISEPMLMHVR